MLLNPGGAVGRDPITGLPTREGEGRGYFFRGDSRQDPQIVFQQGFQAQGTDDDMDNHLDNHLRNGPDSHYVSTTASQRTACGFAVLDPVATRYWVYKIALPGNANEIVVTRPGLNEQEIAVRGGISPQQVIEVQEVDGFGAQVGAPIANPQRGHP